MGADLEEQEDELLALQSIFSSEEFVRDESKSSGKIRVSADLPADFNVVLREGDTLRQYDISFLPPLLLTFELPEDYPSSSPPSFTLTCSWLTHTQLSALGAQLTDLYQATGGAVVLFTWVQFLKEETLVFLDIHTLLELPSYERNAQDTSNAALSEPNSDPHTPESEPTASQSSNVSDPCESDLSAPSLEVEGAVVLDSDQNAEASDSREAEETLQTSEFKTDYHNDLADKSRHPPFAQSDQSSEEAPLNKGNVSASSPLDHSEQGAASLPVHPRESPHREDQTLPGLSLTPSQALLSQLLIYDAEQKQREFATTVFDCSVCFMSLLGSECVQLAECGHIFCKACLSEFCKLQITEGNVRGVTCPQGDCTATPTPAQVKSLVGEELFSRYDRLLLQITLDCMADVVYCPRQSCGSAVILEKSSTAALCSVCGFAFCVTCRKTYHGADKCPKKKNTVKQKETDTQEAYADLPQSQDGMMALWDDYASGNKQRQLLLEDRYGRWNLFSTMGDCLSEHWITHNSKNCPHCFCRIEKNRGCNVMTCSRCRRLFCWLCLTSLQSHSSSHFQDSPCAQYSY
ncbi:E3 ubiquitin-protein ligase RNF14-like [Pempheris klunzingeri]|uniref:E3 ubiquitin-protein ligase RNF14-like n=1 Tax=Pempheris klunzingeri TaxID=3127111 RepID=UPI00397F5614